MKSTCTAVNEDAALEALEAFEVSELGRKYPATAATWRAAWDRIIPFMEFAPVLPKIIHTTNAIELLTYQLRKIIKNKGHFPNDTAVVKRLWLSVATIEDKRARQRAKAASKTEASAYLRLIEGSSTQYWNKALGALVVAPLMKASPVCCRRTSWIVRSGPPARSYASRSPPRSNGTTADAGGKFTPHS